MSILINCNVLVVYNNGLFLECIEVDLLYIWINCLLSVLLVGSVLLLSIRIVLCIGIIHSKCTSRVFVYSYSVFKCRMLVKVHRAQPTDKPSASQIAVMGYVVGLSLRI